MPFKIGTKNNFLKNLPVTMPIAAERIGYAIKKRISKMPNPSFPAEKFAVKKRDKNIIRAERIVDIKCDIFCIGFYFYLL